MSGFDVGLKLITGVGSVGGDVNGSRRVGRATTGGVGRRTKLGPNKDVTGRGCDAELWHPLCATIPNKRVCISY